MRIKNDAAKKAKLVRVDDENVLEPVTNFQSALGKAKASHEQQNTKNTHTDKQREASLRREAQLRSKIEDLKGKLEKAEKSVQVHERRVRHDLPDKKSVQNQGSHTMFCRMPAAERDEKDTR